MQVFYRILCAGSKISIYGQVLHHITWGIFGVRYTYMYKVLKIAVTDNFRFKPCLNRI
jgi:hypothetical protein